MEINYDLLITSFIAVLCFIILMRIKNDNNRNIEDKNILDRRNIIDLCKNSMSKNWILFFIIPVVTKIVIEAIQIPNLMNYVKYYKGDNGLIFKSANDLLDLKNIIIFLYQNLGKYLYSTISLFNFYNTIMFIMIIALFIYIIRVGKGIKRSKIKEIYIIYTVFAALVLLLILLAIFYDNFEIRNIEKVIMILQTILISYIASIFYRYVFTCLINYFKDIKCDNKEIITFSIENNISIFFIIVLTSFIFSVGFYIDKDLFNKYITLISFIKIVFGFLVPVLLIRISIYNEKLKIALLNTIDFIVRNLSSLLKYNIIFLGVNVVIDYFLRSITLDSTNILMIISNNLIRFIILFVIRYVFFVLYTYIIFKISNLEEHELEKENKSI